MQLKHLYKVLRGGGKFELRFVFEAKDNTSLRCSCDFYFYLEKPDLRTFSSAERFKGVCVGGLGRGGVDKGF